MELSSEGTTQCDPLAMPVYALATVPLIMTNTMYVSFHLFHKQLRPGMQTIPQLLVSLVTSIYGGNILLILIGPKFGSVLSQFLQSWLVVKEEFLQEATEIFRDTNIKITAEESISGC
jgi:hypothetical protein